MSSRRTRLYATGGAGALLLALTGVAAGAPRPQADPPTTRPDGASVERVLDVVMRVVDLEVAATTVDQGDRTQLNLATDVLFEFGSAQLTPKAQQTLAAAADALRTKAPGTRVRVDGHTDSIGDDNSNRSLSNQRAQAVADALTRLLGGARVDFVVQGHGEADPIAPNTSEGGGDNPEGRALNRRVTLSFER